MICIGRQANRMTGKRSQEEHFRQNLGLWLWANSLLSVISFYTERFQGCLRLGLSCDQCANICQQNSAAAERHLTNECVEHIAMSSQ